jgi:hypothetical protein
MHCNNGRLQWTRPLVTVSTALLHRNHAPGSCWAAAAGRVYTLQVREHAHWILKFCTPLTDKAMLSRTWTLLGSKLQVGVDVQQVTEHAHWLPNTTYLY